MESVVARIGNHERTDDDEIDGGKDDHHEAGHDEIFVPAFELTTLLEERRKRRRSQETLDVAEKIFRDVRDDVRDERWRSDETDDGLLITLNLIEKRLKRFESRSNESFNRFLARF